MPVKCDVKLSKVGQDQFHAVDKVVMRHAFDIHNEFGRFLDESIYQNELWQRCLESGFEARREVEIEVSYNGFKKSFFIDLLMEDEFVYELKAAVDLITSHDRQLINYLLLTDLNHGKLLNFRPRSLQSRFVSTQLCRCDRTNFQFIGPVQGDEESSVIQLKETLCGLLADWGAFLEISLYREALLILMGDFSSTPQNVEIVSNSKLIGFQKMCMLTPESAWHLSATRRHLDSYETHIRRLLQHTPLKSIHWINFNQHQITHKTLQK